MQWQTGYSSSSLSSSSSRIPVILIRLVAVLIEILGSVIVLVVFRNDIQADRMNLHDLEFGVAFEAGEDLTFLHFVFVHVNLGVALRASHHGKLSLGSLIGTSERII